MSDKQDSLFKKQQDSDLQDAINLLESRGFQVTKLKPSKKNLNMAEVVEHFYTRLKSVSGDTTALTARLSDKQDFKAVAIFHEKAKKTGLSKAAANETLMDLIDMVFDYYRDTKKPCPIYNLSYIISQKGSWVVQMAVQYARRKSVEWEASAEAEAIRRRIYSDLSSAEFKKIQDQRHSEILKEELIHDEEDKKGSET